MESSYVKRKGASSTHDNFARIDLSRAARGQHRTFFLTASIAFAVAIACADWLLPNAHLAYLEIIPAAFIVYSCSDRVGERADVSALAIRQSGENAQGEGIDIGFRALIEAGAAMYGSLDYETTLRNIADAVMRTYCTCCTIDVIEDDGSLRRIATAHQRPEQAELFNRNLTAGPLADNHPLVRAARHGKSTFATNINQPTWTAVRAPNLQQAMDRRRVRSLICVPVRLPDGTLFGALTGWIDEDDPRPAYVQEDVPFAEELGRRAGIAVQHARAYQRERAIAVRFQEASLPATLPELAGVRLSADYRPGNSEATVGGDWYDAFLLADGRLAITIGDVLGKGLDAAVTMANIRQAMRGAASFAATPNAMLAAAEQTLRDAGEHAYATAVAAIYDPASRALDCANAGHPNPLHVHADGTIAELSGSGMMLGLGSVYDETATVTIAAGSTLVWFTDGLTEATRDLDDGYRSLHEAVAQPGFAAAAHPARAVVDRVLGNGHVHDDIAVLVAAFG